MAQNKGFFRNAFDALVEARTREARRQVDHYRHMFDYEAKPKARH